MDLYGIQEQMHLENQDFGNNENKNVFTKIGDTVVKINQKEKIYLELEETAEIISTLENTFNLKVDLVDAEQSHFELNMSNPGVVDITGGIAKAIQYRKNKCNSKAYRYK